MTCKNCNKPHKGRTDKKFCTSRCKSEWHNKRRAVIETEIVKKGAEFIEWDIATLNSRPTI